jgi:hypothetical protein
MIVSVYQLTRPQPDFFDVANGGPAGKTQHRQLGNLVQIGRKEREKHISFPCCSTFLRWRGGNPKNTRHHVKRSSLHHRINSLSNIHERIENLKPTHTGTTHCEDRIIFGEKGRKCHEEQLLQICVSSMPRRGPTSFVKLLFPL